MSLGIIRILGIILFLYLTWRNLRGNYLEGKLITFSWLSLLGFFVFGRVGFGLLNWGVWRNWQDWLLVWQKPGMDYLMATLGFILVSFWFGKVNQWKFFAFLEDNLRNFLVFLSILMVDELVRSRFDIKVMAYLVIFLIAYLVSWWLFKNYRSFVWYRSGKKGFVFLFTTFLINLLVALVLFWKQDKLILIILSLLVSLISLTGLFILGEVFQPLMFNKRRKNETE
ncbi:MAG: hypothetical protein PHX34_01840 [Candidatus Shapirobacteria bacterium]|nr:hypothetical protein [Candidatus Shapirobacteria bacterium]